MKKSKKSKTKSIKSKKVLKVKKKSKKYQNSKKSKKFHIILDKQIFKRKVTCATLGKIYLLLYFPCYRQMVNAEMTYDPSIQYNTIQYNRV